MDARILGKAWRMRIGCLALASVGLISSCLPLTEVECDAHCREHWMDGENVRDPSLSDSTYRVSTRIPNPTAEDLEKPVILAVHGFTASTYEWMDFRNWAEADGNVMVSMVLLGGHGRSIEEFRESTWEEWGAPILAEYRALADKGYTKLSIATASTGGPLLLESISSGGFAKLPAPKQIFLIDPILSPSDKLLSLVNLAGPVVGNSPSEGTEEESRHWYVNRPAETLGELYELISRVKNRLERGIALPSGTHCKVYKTKVDGAADPISALYLKKGLQPRDGGVVEVEMLDSRKHVFTRKAGRSESSWSEADEKLQLRAFNEMKSRLLQ